MRKPLLQQIVGAILMMFVAVLGAVLSGPVGAQTPERLVLDPRTAPYELAPFTQVFIEEGTTARDWDARLLLADLVALEDAAFAPVTTRKVGFGWNDVIVHARIPVENATGESGEWILAFNQTKWGERQVSLVIEGAPLPDGPLFVFGEAAPWEDPDRLVYTRFEMPAQTRGYLYVSYVNPASSAPMSIETVEDYQHDRLVNDLTIYVLLGLVVGVALLTVSLIGVLHQRVALYYAGYVACAALHFCFILDLFHPSPVLSVLMQPLFSFFWWVGFSSVFYLLFQRAYFANEQRISALPRRILEAAIVGNVVLLLAYGLLGMPFEIYIAFAALCIVVIIGNGVLAIVKQITGRWFFALGCFSIGLMFVPLMMSDFLTAHYTYEEAAMVFLYGLAVEAIALSCAMFMKVREIRAEREEALVAELRLTQEKLEASRRLAAAAHDIQQPLSSLRMALTGPGGGAPQSGDIDQAIDYLDEIVRTQMADTKADLTEHPAPQDIGEEEFEVDLIFRNLRAMFADEAQGKGLSLRVAPTSMRAQTSPLGLMRILSNLVSNAIRNTNEGGILVGCRHHETHVRIHVCDTGVGLSAQDCETLQEPYRRNGDYEGHGLGLSIVRQLCDEYGLTFGVTSQVGRGSVFHVLIPKAGP